MNNVQPMVTTGQDEADTLVARLQKAGHGARQLQDGTWLAHRWGLSVHLPDITALRRFANNVLGGTKNV
ncbi:MAG: hypothetical protein IPH35_15305 [Rhodoferax sp.]|nr:hypothetical protein [Rhodoferax sp.]